MRRDQDIVHFPQRRLGRQRLGVDHVDDGRWCHRGRRARPECRSGSGDDTVATPARGQQQESQQGNQGDGTSFQLASFRPGRRGGRHEQPRAGGRVAEQELARPEQDPVDHDHAGEPRHHRAGAQPVGGDVERESVVELPMGTPFNVLLGAAGGVGIAAVAMFSGSLLYDEVFGRAGAGCLLRSE